MASVGFFIVFLGTLFLFGELLVKAKGIFALIGIGIMTTYFSFHITAGSGLGLWVTTLYLCGVMLIIIDGKFIAHGSLAFFGAFLMMVGIALPTPNFIYGFLVAMALLLGIAASALFLKVFPARDLWSKMTLKESLTSELGYNSLNAAYKELIDKNGVTTTPFRPTGTIEIDGKYYSATTSDSQWINAGTKVKVISVDGTKIVVQQIIAKNE